MARTTYVKKARKDQGLCMSPNCRAESREIKAGDPYKWFSIRSHRAGRGQRKQYHPQCPVPRSHTTTSAQLGTIYDAVEAAESEMASLDSYEIGDLEVIGQAAAEGIREAGEMYGEGADNIESGFGHETYVSQELREKAEGCESWADEIEQVDYDEFDEDDEPDEEALRRETEVEVAVEMGVTNAAALDAADLLDALNTLDLDTQEFEDTVNERVEEAMNENEPDEEKREEWWDEQKTKLQDALDNQPF